MAKIKRRKVETNYTVVENDFLRDLDLGLTERGLLVTMLSLPDNWDYSANGLANILPDGRKKTNNSLQRLERAGYLKRSRIYENGKVVDWLYEFCEQPIFKDKNLFLQKGEVDKNLFPPFVQVEKEQVEKVEVEKGAHNKNTQQENTKESSFLLNQSINQKTQKETQNPTITLKKIPDRLIDNKLIEDIKEQIEYDFLHKERKMSEDDLNLVVNILADLYTTTEPLKINKRTYAPDFVQQCAMRIESCHVEYVWECFENQHEKINNVRNYLLTAIFNAPATIGAYYTNTVRADGVV